MLKLSLSSLEYVTEAIKERFREFVVAEDGVDGRVSSGFESAG